MGTIILDSCGRTRGHRKAPETARGDTRLLSTAAVQTRKEPPASSETPDASTTIGANRARIPAVGHGKSEHLSMRQEPSPAPPMARWVAAWGGNPATAPGATLGNPGGRDLREGTREAGPGEAGEI